MSFEVKLLSYSIIGKNNVCLVHFKDLAIGIFIRGKNFREKKIIDLKYR